MTRRPAWYRSGPTLDAEPPADLARPSLRRRIRGWLRDRLPDPVVRDRTMVLYGRDGLRANTRWPGMFSEFFSVLGALDYGERHGAAGLRVDFRSPHYLDPDRGPNWWLYFFERDFLPMGRLCAESAWASLAEAGAMNPRAEAGRLRARLTGSSPSGAVRIIERDPAGEALIDEPVEAFPFAPCCRLASCQGEIEAGIVALL